MCMTLATGSSQAGSSVYALYNMIYEVMVLRGTSRRSNDPTRPLPQPVANTETTHPHRSGLNWIDPCGAASAHVRATARLQPDSV
jgi:hypothetical protein